MATEIHPTAHLDPAATLGSDVAIGPGAIIGADVVLGDRVRVGPYAVLTGHTRIGEDTRIWPGVVIGEEPQDRGFKGGRSDVEIGPRCMIREYVTIHRGTQEGSVTQVGAGCMLMATSHVAHNCVVGEGVTLANGVLLAGHITLEDHVFLSGNVVVHQFVRLGARVMVGGNGRVTRDIPPFVLAKNDNELQGLNLVGLKRAGTSREAIRELKRMYAEWAAAESFEQFARELAAGATTPEGRRFAGFLASPSRRGLVRPPRPA